MTTDKVHPPRIFISYSWTSEVHTQWVADLGERLMSDGVDVVLDQWSLKDGQDLNAFMEQMVTDPTIKRVIIVSDALYSQKANARRGGVGTESQIISQEVYEKVDQEKFIPVVRERDEDGKPCLPVFLKSRKYIDYSDVDREAEAYDQLLRNIYERPVRRKPVLGTPPSHLFDDNAVVIPAAQKAKRFCDLVRSGKGNQSAAFEDFAEEFITNSEDLRLTYSHDQEKTWCKTLFNSIERARQYRDMYVDVVKTGVAHIHEGWFMGSLLSFLERLLPFQCRPQELGAYFRCSDDNYKFILYELFLYTIAACMKARRYSDARLLFDHHYVAPATFDSQKTESFSFVRFDSYPESLEENCAQRGNTRRLSVAADLLVDRADRKDIRFADVLQADVVCCIASFRNGHSPQWYPRSLVFSNRVGKLELFARAVSDSGFEPLKILLRYSSPQEMFAHILSSPMDRIWQGERFMGSVHVRELFNMDELSRVWNTDTKTGR